MALTFTGGITVAGKLTSTITPDDSFTVNAVNFDGTNDYLNHGVELTGATDDSDAIFSLWFNLTGGDGSFMNFYNSPSNRIEFRRQDGGQLRFGIRNSANASLWEFQSTSTFTTSSNSGWHHFLAAVSMVGGNIKTQVYLDDVVLAKADLGGIVAGSLDWTQSSFFIGVHNSIVQMLNADLADVYLNNGEFLDITDVNNRRLFIDASGKPVDLGSDGSTPTGNPPLIFLSGATDSWHTNKGTGGGFTETGALTTASTSPSD